MTGRRSPLEDVLAVFECWLYLPDPGVVEITLAAMAANRLPGDPVWLLLTGAASGGKTEVLQSLSDLPNVHPLATLTEAALLSGTPADKAKNGTGGLLREINQFGVLLLKDFTSVLSLGSEKRIAVFAALREIFDGSWTRAVGSDGGRTLSWQGKVGLIGGVTSSIDSHHGVMSAMGQRLALYRLPEIDGREHARRAISNTGKEEKMRAEMREAVTTLFGTLKDGAPGKPSPADLEWIPALTSLVVQARSAVDRDGYFRDISMIHNAEAPGRLSRTLTQLLLGLRIIGCSPQRQRQLILKVGFDCIPPIRRIALEALLRSPALMTTEEIAAGTKYPGSTIRRALEDLRSHSLVEHGERQGSADSWHIAAEWREQFERARG